MQRSLQRDRISYKDLPVVLSKDQTIRFKDAINQVEKKPRVLILRLRKVLSLDATGLSALEEVHERTMRENTLLILSGVHAQPLVVMQRAGFIDKVGEENIVGDIDDALNHARERLGLPRQDMTEVRHEITRR
jgi:SulP family sulfate permease